MNKLEIIYYLGILGLVSALILIASYQFKTHNSFDLENNFKLLIIYIIILILSVILWNLFFNFLFGFHNMINDKFNYESVING